MAKIRLLVGALVTIGFLTLLTAAASPAAWSAGAPPSINGTWTCCDDGGGTAQVWDINGASGTVTTAHSGAGAHGTITVSYTWPDVTIDEDFPSSGFTEDFSGTVSASGNEMSGTYESDIGSTGSWSAIPVGSARSIDGTWFCCGAAGGAAAQDWSVNGNTGTGSVAGSQFATLQVSYNWPLVSIETIYTDSSYTATFIGVISDNATTMSGTWTSNANQSGTWTATLAGSGGLNGVWFCCRAGPGESELVFSGSTGYVDNGGVDIATLQVTSPGPQVAFSAHYIDGGLTQTYTGTMAPNGQTMSGTWTDSDGGSGTWTATFEGESPPGPPAYPSRDATPAPITTSLGTPGEVFHDVPRDIANAAIAVGAILFITFPANIFNQTFSANYGEILVIVGGWRRRARRLLGMKDKEPAPAQSPAASAPADTAALSTPGKATALWFGAVLVMGAILGGLLNPHFGLNGTTAANFVSTLLAFAFGAVVSWFVAHRFRRWHHYGTVTYLKALPLGLGIAALCVLISRVSNFQPGYLYGVVVGVAFAETIADRHNAHLTAISTLTTLTVAIVAWLIWIPVNHLSLAHLTNLPLSVLDDLLGSIFVGGIVGTVVGLIPLVTMPGHTLIQWRKDAWAAVMFLATFLLIAVELRPASGPSHSGGAPWVTVLVLFVFFGGGTFAMRAYFARRTPQVALAVATPAAAPPSVVPVEGAAPGGTALDEDAGGVPPTS